MCICRQVLLRENRANSIIETFPPFPLPAEHWNSKLTESLLKPFIGELVGLRIFHSRVGLDHPHVRLTGRPVAQRVGTRIFRKAQLQG